MEVVNAVASDVTPEHPDQPGPALGDRGLIDDLTRIDGITEAMATALAAEGLGSFFAVANAREDDLRRALRVHRIRSAPGVALWAARATELTEQAKAERAREPENTPPENTPPENTPPEITPEEITPPQASAPRSPRVLAGSAFRTTARPGGPSWTTVSPAREQDLEQIHGVDHEIAVALRSAGVTNYTLLAAVRDEELRHILDEAGLEAPPTLSTWSVQAALLLQGDQAGAATLAGGLMVGHEED
jgi:predicted flap endonuclease-1-like 5' DNA nuclease